MHVSDCIQSGVFLDVSSLDRGDIDFRQLKQQAKQMQLRSMTGQDELNDVLKNQQLVISNKVVLDKQVLVNNPQIKLICVAATGANNIDLRAAHELGISVCNVSGYATPSVVQHVFSLLLNLVTRLNEVQLAVHRGEWSASPHFCLLDYPIQELAGKTLGIVGFGELGQGVASVAKALGMKLLVAKRNALDDRPGRMDLVELLPIVDVLSLHCPLTADTRGLISTAELSLMKHSAWLINTARGGIVDEAALLDALQSGEIAGAGIDVLEQEPPQRDHPLLGLNLPNLIVTPHVAWASRESRQRLVDEIVLNIQAFHNDQSRNPV